MTMFGMNITKRQTKTTIDVVPRPWAGQCDCGTESLMVMATFDDDMNLAMYELYGTCSWCGMPWFLPEPVKAAA